MNGNIGGNVNNVSLAVGSTRGGDTDSEVKFFGNNSYTGSTTISAGELEIFNSSAIPDSSAVVMTAATPGSSKFDIRDDETIGSLAGDANSRVVFHNSSILTTGGDNTSTTFAGNISDDGGSNGGITKVGTGTFTLSGNNSYGGITTVDSGKLVAASSSALGSSVGPGAVTNVNAGATLGVTGGVTLAETITLVNNARLINDSGDNTISSQIQLLHDIFDVPNVTTAHIGSTAGTLTLSGGIEDHNTAPDMSLSLNTEAGQNGNLVISGPIGASVQNVTIGNPGGTGSVTLSGNNLYGSGFTFLNGAIVNVTTDTAFSSTRVIQTSSTNLNGTAAGPGPTLANDFQLNPATTITVDGNLSITGVIAGAGSLTVDGNTGFGAAAVLSLSGANTYSGTTTVTGSAGSPGTLNLGNTMSSTTYDVNTNGTLNLGLPELLPNVSVANVSGTLGLNGTETIKTFNLTGPGSTLNGTGLLLAETYNLSNGATTVAGANMGAGVLNSAGAAAVTLGGDSAAEDVNINSGTFNLNGQLTDVTDLTISAGATVALGSSERINDPAVVNNNGTLNLGGTETVKTFNSTGTLGGVGTLITTGNTINLLNGHVSLIGANLQNLAGPNPQLTSNGTVNINGTANNVNVAANATINVGTAVIQSGTMNLNGLFIGTPTITINNGATLASGSANRINGDSATVNVNNGGTWTLGGNDLIGTFNSSGLLNGAGTLTATTYNLSNGGTTNAGANLGTGTLNSGPGTVTLNGNAAVGIANVNSGTLNLNGQLTAVNNLTISSGATVNLGSANRIFDGATVNNFGELDLNGNDTIATYNANGGFLDDAGTLTASTYNLSNGASTDNNANLGTGTLNSGPGTVTLNGNAAVGTANVNSGTLNLNGQLTAVNNLTISSGATVNLGSAERINNGATVNNFGELDLNGNEIVTTYNANGGFLDDAGTLTATTYNLSNGASTDSGANLGTGTLNSGPGTVTLNGNTNANTTNVNSGNLVTNGAVQNAGGTVTVNGGATWNVNGSYTYNTLRGNGTVDPGGINGTTFTNQNTISPGTSIGTLTIAGNYTESGIYHAELAPSPTSDTIRVTGSAFLDGSSRLRLVEFGGLVGNSGNVLCGERWNIISTPGVIGGGWSEISDVNNPGGLGNTFQSQVLFDRGTGDVVALGLTAGQTIANYAGITANQTNILNAVLVGATDNLIVGNYNSRDAGSGNVLNAIYTAGAPGNKPALLNAVTAVSPEGYAGVVDYALHVTRGYAQNAMASTTPIGGGGFGVALQHGGDAKGVMPPPPAPARRNIEVFAGYSHLSLGTSSSLNNRDYDLRSDGGYAGARMNANPNLAFGGFVAVDTGTVEATGGLDLDVDGFVLGAFVNYDPQGPDGPIHLWANGAFGSFDYDGVRQGLVARYRVPEHEATAFQLGFGGGYDVYEGNGLTITPVAGLRYLDADTDGFTETGGAGALTVAGQDQDAFLLDLAVRFLYQMSGQPFAVHGEAGWQHDFSGSERQVTARLAAGGPAFSVLAPGLGDDAFTYGVGAYYDFLERYRVGVSYRGEYRDDAELFHGVDVRVSFGF